MSARISARAREDLAYIYARISSTTGSDAADQFLERARQATSFLAQNPHAGPHPSWATRHKSLRFWVVRGTRFLIYYFPDEIGISIERVLDGRRDVRRIMELGIEDPSDEEE